LRAQWPRRARGRPCINRTWKDNRRPCPIRQLQPALPSAPRRPYAQKDRPTMPTGASVPINKPLALALGALLIASPALAQEEAVLNVYNWSDYIAEDTIANFEAETGIKVNYDVYDSNEIVDAKLLAGNSGYDIVVPSGNFVERQIKFGL